MIATPVSLSEAIVDFHTLTPIGPLGSSYAEEVVRKPSLASLVDVSKVTRKFSQSRFSSGGPGDAVSSRPPQPGSLPHMAPSSDPFEVSEAE